MPKKDYSGRDLRLDEIANFIAVDVDDDGNPDAVGVCNPDGSPVGASARLIDDCEVYTDWSAVAASAADTIAASTTHRIGAKSVSFAKNGTAVIAAIQKSWPVAINYGVEEAAREAIQWTMYLPTVVGVTNVFIRLGKDATNYAQVTVPVASLKGAQWNRISVQFLDDTAWTQVGTGFDTADLRYIAIGITTAAAATAIAGILIDNILSIDYVETNMRASITVTTAGVTKIEGGVGGAILDVTADGGNNAAFVQSNSLATEVTVATLATEATAATLATEATVATLATEATVATLGTEATLATLATEATTAKEATLALVATEATLATLATEATTAKEATLALVATEATLATLGTEATLATLATEATAATLATEATAATLATEATTAKEATLALVATEATTAKEATLALVATEATVSTLATEATVATLATEATLSTIESETSNIESSVDEMKNVVYANDAVVGVGKGNLGAAKYEAALTTVTAGNAAISKADQYGRLHVNVSAADAGLATSAKQDTGNSSLSNIDGKLGTLGQKAMSGSAPVVMASDQSALPTRGEVVLLGSYTSSGSWNLIGGATNLGTRDSEGVRGTNGIKFDGAGSGVGVYCGIETTFTAVGVPRTARNIQLRVIFSCVDGATYGTLQIRVRAGANERTFTVPQSSLLSYWNVVYIPWEDPSYALSVNTLPSEAALTRVYFEVDDTSGSTYIVNEISLCATYAPLADKYGNPITSKDEGSAVQSIDTNVRSNTAQAASDAAAPAQVVALGAKYESALTSVGTTNDITALKATKDGRLIVEEKDSATHWEYHGNFAAAQTDLVLKAAPGAGLKIRILGYSMSTDAAVSFNVQDADDATVLGTKYLTARQTIHVERCDYRAPTNKALELDTIGAVNHSIDIHGDVVPA